MFKKLQNLWKLADLEADVTPEGVVLKTSAKPKGQATIVDMTPQVDLFPEPNENL